MIQKHISDEILLAVQETFMNSPHIKTPKSQEHETDMVNEFLNDFKKQLDQQNILRVEVLSKW